MICVSFISGNPTALKQSINAYAKEFCDGKIAASGYCLVIVNPLAVHEQNKEFLEKFEEKTSISTIQLHDHEIPGLLPEYAEIFQPNYGGLRNACLLIAALKNAHAVFFDDDTRPANNCLERYEKLFEEGKKIICGKYLTHAHGTSALLSSLVLELEKSKPDAKKIKALFSGIPKKTTEIILGAGLNGGNTGVSFEALKKYCFFPTHYRIEDGTYATLAPLFLKDGESVYIPINYYEAGEKLPVVYHEKKTRSINELRNSLINEVQGSIIASIIHETLAKKIGEPSEEDLLELRNTHAPYCYKDYLIPYLKEKNVDKNFEEKIRLLDDKEVTKEYQALLSLNLEQMLPSIQETREAIKLFNETQATWPKAIEAAREKNLLDLI